MQERVAPPRDAYNSNTLRKLPPYTIDSPEKSLVNNPNSNVLVGPFIRPLFLPVPSIESGPKGGDQTALSEVQQSSDNLVVLRKCKGLPYFLLRPGVLPTSAKYKAWILLKQELAAPFRDSEPSRVCLFDKFMSYSKLCLRLKSNTASTSFTLPFLYFPFPECPGNKPPRHHRLASVDEVAPASSSPRLCAWQQQF